MITSADMAILMDRSIQWSFMKIFCTGRNHQLSDLLSIEERHFSVLGEY